MIQKAHANSPEELSVGTHFSRLAQNVSKQYFHFRNYNNRTVFVCMCTMIYEK